MNTVSFMTANYVARELDYNMTRGWGQGDKATNEALRPLEQFGDRFEMMLSDIQTMGFEAIDLWLAHLNPAWATRQHIEEARALLDKYGFPVVSFAGWFGSTMEEFEATCRLAVELNCQILGGSTSVLEKDRAGTVALLTQYGLKLGLENHPEKTPEEMLAKIGDGGDGTIGTTVDTGWYGTQGYDAAKALEWLAPYLFHIHLKDVLAVGAHDTCRFGQGIVPIQACVRTLQEIGYEGGISVEHEPEQFDPTQDVIASRQLLEEWMKG